MIISTAYKEAFVTIKDDGTERPPIFLAMRVNLEYVSSRVNYLPLNYLLAFKDKISVQQIILRYDKIINQRFLLFIILCCKVVCKR